MADKHKATKVLGIYMVAVLIAVIAIMKLREVGRETPKARWKQPGFNEVARESGIDFHMTFLTNEQGQTFKLNLYDHGCGVVVGDYNGDGFDDVYFLNQFGENALFKNKGNGTFENTTKNAGELGLGDRISVGATFSDYDNDGDQDLFVTTVRAGNVLYQNQGNGTFRDTTKEAGLTHIGHSSTAAFFDYDNDGDLDLFLANTASWTKNSFDEEIKYFPGRGENLRELVESPKEYNIFYRNNGDGTFTNVTKETGLKGRGWGGDTGVVDYDEDGDLDLLVTNMFGQSQLYRNESNGKFTDVTLESLKRTSWGAIGSKFFDFNNDGHLDLYIVDMHSDMWTSPNYALNEIDESIKYDYVVGPTFNTSHGELGEKEFVDGFDIKYEQVLFGNSFFKNLGNGKFEEISDQANLETFWPWGVATGDFDNDGDQDVYLPAGMGYPFAYWKSNYLLINNGDETFTERAYEAGIEPPVRGAYLNTMIRNNPMPRSSRCAATADFDGDGRLDLMVNNFNDHPYYFKNSFDKMNYIAFKLKGTKSNRDAIGALVKIPLGNQTLVRQVQAAGGYLSQCSKTLHFGLGRRERVGTVEIRWPSGIRQTIKSPLLNQVHTVTEPEEKAEKSASANTAGPAS